MGKKNTIIILLLVVTSILILTVRYVFIQDSNQSQLARISSFSEALDMHKNYVFSSKEKTSNIIFKTLENDFTLKTLLHYSSKEYNPRSKDVLNTFINNQLKQFETLGIANIQVVPNNGLNEKKSTIKYNGDNPWVLDFKDSKQMTSGICLTNNETAYQFIYQLIDKNKILGHLIITFNIDGILSDIKKVNPSLSIGYLLEAKQSMVLSSRTKKAESVNGILDHYRINEAFNFPKQLLTDESACHNINNRLIQSSNTHDNTTFSEYIKSDDQYLALSFSQLNHLSNSVIFYLVTINNDPILPVIKDMNLAIYIINIIIILMAMIGIAYLIINRLDLIRRTRKIKKSEEKLKELNKSKDKFFSIIAHDLKNPFNGIMGMSGYLNTEYDNVTDEERKEIINDINISSKNAFNLLQNLLEWTRTQSGTIRNNPTYFAPEQVIELSLETVYTLAKNKEINIIQNIETDKKGYADENLISTVIRNLSTNAIKFSPRNSEIEIKVRDYSNEIVFSIQDKGIGLFPEEIDQLFRIDLNFHKKGTEQETGTGLGLKLCKEFIEYCKGRIWVISEKNVGSTFFFTIPSVKK